MRIIKAKDVSKISYRLWSYKHEIDISLIKKIEIDKLKTNLIFKKGGNLFFKTTVLEILGINDKEILHA